MIIREIDGGRAHRTRAQAFYERLGFVASHVDMLLYLGESR